jgi:hypothetical protein
MNVGGAGVAGAGPTHDRDFRVAVVWWAGQAPKSMIVIGGWGYSHQKPLTIMESPTAGWKGSVTCSARLATSFR